MHLHLFIRKYNIINKILACLIPYKFIYILVEIEKRGILRPTS